MIIDFLKKKKVSELPEATDTTGFWIFGSKTVGGVITSVKFAFDNIIPLFGISQDKGQSITLAPSLKLFSDETDKKADAKNKDGQAPIYGELATEISEANKAKIPNVEAVLNAIGKAATFREIDDSIWDVAIGYINDAGDKVVQWGIRHDGHIYPMHDLLDSRAFKVYNDDIWKLAITDNSNNILYGVRHDGQQYPLSDIERRLKQIEQKIQ